MKLIENFNVSVVIPTWNRKEKLLEVILAFINQDSIPINYELLICDSDSPDGTEDYINNFIKKNRYDFIKIIQCEFNNTALKRNQGIKNSIYENIILLDDDCVPFPNFFENYSGILIKSDNKSVFCGEYRIRKKLLKSNYSKYRDSRYFGSNSWNISRENGLDFHTIVTGNMAFKKEVISKKKIYFNEKMVGYGLQDIEWAWRLKLNNITINRCETKVFHDETSGNIRDYRKKIYFVAKDAMLNLKIVNYKAAKEYKFFFLEKETKLTIIKLICNIFYNRLFEKIILLPIEFFLLKTDNIRFFYFPILYKIIILYGWIDGIRSRKDGHLKNNDTKKGWYAKGNK
ncbi:glycosyltransferase [Pelagibacterales bacterium]|nr:glycosyltransferase [Pelagibacterales bacterium]